jgi:purine-binding chemotaxis protein CheW
MTDRRIGLLIFTLAGERYALPVERVREVVRAVAVTRLAGAPRVVDGLIDVRGRPVPVFDVRQRFGLASGPPHPDQVYVLTDTGRRVAALRVDAVEWLREVALDEIAEPRRFVREEGPVAGVVTIDDGLALIHDVERFLTAAEEATLERALEEHAADGGAARG